MIMLVWVYWKKWPLVCEIMFVLSTILRFLQYKILSSVTTAVTAYLHVKTNLFWPPAVLVRPRESLYLEPSLHCFGAVVFEDRSAIPADVNPTVESCFEIEMLPGTWNVMPSFASSTYTMNNNIVDSTEPTSSTLARSTAPVSANKAHFVDSSRD